MTADPTTTHLLYLHGFRSSPQSTKARQMAAVVADRFPQVQWWCPQLPPSPQAAAALIAQGTAHWPTNTSAVIGSSLGGFYATWVAVQRGWRAVLINPAVDPARDLSRYIGEQTSWHDPQERFFFAPKFVDALRDLAVGPLPHPQHFMTLIAKGDEVLDWHEMATRYAGAQQTILEGGDHALSDFEQHIPQVLDFLHLA